jgi:hypothetical protein
MATRNELETKIEFLRRSKKLLREKLEDDLKKLNDQINGVIAELDAMDEAKSSSRPLSDAQKELLIRLNNPNATIRRLQSGSKFIYDFFKYNETHRVNVHMGAVNRATVEVLIERGLVSNTHHDIYAITARGQHVANKI